MRLLLADDEPSIRRLYTQMLEGNGFDVQVATDGQETLDAAVGGSFDLIILDLKIATSGWVRGAASATEG
jgi:DNA-binding response OmpR family regulator